MIVVITYILYLLISILITVWVARTLSKNGRVFLIEKLGGKTELADSINHMLVVGFYLINIGYVSLVLKDDNVPSTVAQSIEVLSAKIGMVLLVLGFMHFFNMYVISKWSKNDAITPIADTHPV
jgi:TRAP-type C4-dicarboxylate transport system permease large subunit